MEFLFKEFIIQWQSHGLVVVLIKGYAIGGKMFEIKIK